MSSLVSSMLAVKAVETDETFDSDNTLCGHIDEAVSVHQNGYLPDLKTE